MTRKTLIVGGSGMIGSYISTELHAHGDEITIASRRPADAGDPPSIHGLPRMSIDYTDETLTPQMLEGFDAVVFTAGNDIRHVKAEDESDEFWRRVQIEAVPRFTALARDAGVKRFVQIGSYYHHLKPEWAHGRPYIAARKAADEGARALVTSDFAPITLNPPSIVGATPGRVARRFKRMIEWLRGELATPELFAPAGGTNYMSARSLAQAVAAALDHGEGGRAYLVGDENLRYVEYFQKFADAAGSTITIEERDEEQPFQADRFIVQGRGNVISFEPDPELSYDRNDIDRALAEIVALAV